jgi:predicted RecA/RadA family phage recombinase
MTTPVLYLDADDEITSAAARIRSTDAERIALVLPYGSRLATSRINFRLLAREAVERGKTIEIVAADASARALATSAGLPVYASVAAFESAAAGPAAGGEGTPGAAVVLAPPGEVLPIREEDTPTSVILIPRTSRDRVPVVGRPRPPVSAGVAVGAGFAVVGVLVVGAILAFLLLPSAAIVLHPRSEGIGPLSVNVEGRPDVTAPDQAALTIPSRQFPFDLEAHQTFPATGVKVTDAAARGSVIFSSFDTGSSNRIPVGSIVKTQGGTSFRTLGDVTLPPATVTFPDFVVVPSTSSVSVEAVASGLDGNVAPNTIVVVPKAENKNLTKVTNPQATSGGVHEEAKHVTQADVNGALTKLNTALASDFETKVEAATGVPAGTTIFPETKSLGATTPSVDPSTLVGKLANQFDLGLAAQGTVVGVDASPVRALANAYLGSKVGTGWVIDPPSIAIDIGAPSVVGDVVSFPVAMRATRVRTVDAAALLASVRGLDLPAARAKLAELGDVVITVWPDWVTSIPTNPDRSTMSLGDPEPAPSPTP